MFNFSFDKRILYMMIIIFILPTVIGFFQSQDSLLGLLLTLPGIIIGITFHEFAHAITAYKLGDDTPKNQGRLSLNPIDHLDLVGFILMIVARFGWGKPVQTNPRNYTRKISMDKGEAIVAIAGPIMNFLIAGILYLIYFLILKNTGVGILVSAGGGIAIFKSALYILQLILLFTVNTNIVLGIFNLIPLPPLDGSKILKAFLPSKAKMWYINHEQILYLVFLILWLLMSYI